MLDKKGKLKLESTSTLYYLKKHLESVKKITVIYFCPLGGMLNFDIFSNTTARQVNILISYINCCQIIYNTIYFGKLK